MEGNKSLRTDGHRLYYLTFAAARQPGSAGISATYAPYIASFGFALGQLDRAEYGL